MNGGEFENIALLSNGRDVTITNLRAGEDGSEFASGTSVISSAPDGETEFDYFTIANVAIPVGH